MVTGTVAGPGKREGPENGEPASLSDSAEGNLNRRPGFRGRGGGVQVQVQVLHSANLGWPKLDFGRIIDPTRIWKVGSCYVTCYITGGVLYHIFLLYNMLYGGVT
jgi:hypothetical protein